MQELFTEIGLDPPPLRVYVADFVAKAIPEENLSSSARAARFGQTGQASGAGQSRINLEDNELRGKSEGGCSC